jgi:hypothetical protein
MRARTDYSALRVGVVEPPTTGWGKILGRERGAPALRPRTRSHARYSRDLPADNLAGQTHSLVANRSGSMRDAGWVRSGRRFQNGHLRSIDGHKFHRESCHTGCMLPGCSSRLDDKNLSADGGSHSLHQGMTVRLPPRAARSARQGHRALAGRQC